MFEPWPGSLCCVLGQDTLLSQCLSQSLHPILTNSVFVRVTNLTFCGEMLLALWGNLVDKYLGHWLRANCRHVVKHLTLTVIEPLHSVVELGTGELSGQPDKNAVDYL